MQDVFNSEPVQTIAEESMDKNFEDDQDMSDDQEDTIQLGRYHDSQSMESLEGTQVLD